MFSHAGLHSVAQKVGVKEGLLRLLSDCTNFKKTNVFLTQCLLLAITPLKINAFFEIESMKISREAVVSLLLTMLIKLKPVKQSDKGAAEKNDLENVEDSDKETVQEIDREFTFKQMQTETLLYCQN